MAGHRAKKRLQDDKPVPAGLSGQCGLNETGAG